MSIALTLLTLQIRFGWIPTTPTITTTHETLVKNTWNSEDHEGQHEFLQAFIQKPCSMGQSHISAGTETLKLLNCQNPFPETKKRKSQGHGLLPLQAF
jgi:hypothetical protein